MTVKDLNKILRQQLILQSGLDSKNVLNSLSTYGTDLDKLLSGVAYSSYASSDVALLFELQSRNNDSDVSFDENNAITYAKSYELKCHLYGDSSADIANKMIARFRTERVRQALIQSSVYVEEVTDAIEVKEFINNVLWLRSDFSILITCEFSFEHAVVDNDFDSLSSISIIKEDS